MAQTTGIPLSVQLHGRIGRLSLILSTSLANQPLLFLAALLPVDCRLGCKLSDTVMMTSASFGSRPLSKIDCRLLHRTDQTDSRRSGGKSPPSVLQHLNKNPRKSYDDQSPQISDIF